MSHWEPQPLVWDLFQSKGHFTHLTLERVSFLQFWHSGGSVASLCWVPCFLRCSQSLGPGGFLDGPSNYQMSAFFQLSGLLSFLRMTLLHDTHDSYSLCNTRLRARGCCSHCCWVCKYLHFMWARGDQFPPGRPWQSSTHSCCHHDLVSGPGSGCQLAEELAGMAEGTRPGTPHSLFLPSSWTIMNSPDAFI